MTATQASPAPPRTRITALHTLGPTDTNSEHAARTWLRRHGVDDPDAVRLFATIEEGIEALPDDPGVGLLACIVYPQLHEVVFRNLHRLRIVDCFVVDTHDMVLAAPAGRAALPRVVASHPAPVALLPAGAEHVAATSNATAAIACARGEVDACITTAPAAAAQGLEVVRNFGPVPMGFSVHARPETA